MLSPCHCSLVRLLRIAVGSRAVSGGVLRLALLAQPLALPLALPFDRSDLAVRSKNGKEYASKPSPVLSASLYLVK